MKTEKESDISGDSHNLEITFHGPFRFLNDKESSVFKQPLALKQGIYVWTVPSGEEYLPYYIGETGGIIRKQAEIPRQGIPFRNLSGIRNGILPQGDKGEK
jgi:hypothetical protein